MSRPSPVRAVPTLEFDPNDWARRYKANGDEAEANSFMDSGWSGAVAERCHLVHTTLLLELLKQLQEVEIKPKDFFDRPKLAAVLAAVHEINR